MQKKFYTLDVFTNKPFGGNQLAVFPHAEGLSEEIMQKIALEFNFSETVFVFPLTNQSDSDDNSFSWKVRIFTPGGEIPFAGHPTIGTAFLLAKLEKINLSTQPVTIYLIEPVGKVPVILTPRENQSMLVELVAPNPPIFYSEIPSLSVLAEVLSLSVSDLQVDDFNPQAVSCGLPFLLIPVRNVDVLAQININQSLWEDQIKNFVAPHLYPFCSIGEDNWRVRMFAPALNIVEDPATGSAATAFSAYLAHKNNYRDGVWEFDIEQGIEIGRNSQIKGTVVKNNGQISKIKVGGECVIVTEGFFNI